MAAELDLHHALALSIALSWLWTVHRPSLPPCGLACFAVFRAPQGSASSGRFGCGFSSMRRAVYAFFGMDAGCSFGNSFCTPLRLSMASLAMGASMSRLDMAVWCHLGTIRAVYDGLVMDRGPGGS